MKLRRICEYLQKYRIFNISEIIVQLYDQKIKRYTNILIDGLKNVSFQRKFAVVFITCAEVCVPTVLAFHEKFQQRNF
jgi:hypothetical protein